MLEWMRYSERHNTKIPKKTMDCLETHYLISPEKIESLPGNISSRMSAETDCELHPEAGRKMLWDTGICVRSLGGLLIHVRCIG